MKKTTVRGTPVNHVGPAGASIGDREGYSPGKPAGLKGTQPEGYDSEKSGYRSDPRSGTPYNSDLGNPDESRRVVSQHRYGIVLSENGQNHNDPASNGSGTIFDGASRANGYMANGQPYPDSPVPKNAPWFDTRSIEQEDRAHLGQGNEDAAENDLRKIPGGVMGRDDD